MCVEQGAVNNSLFQALKKSLKFHPKLCLQYISLLERTGKVESSLFFIHVNRLY